MNSVLPHIAASGAGSDSFDGLKNIINAIMVPEYSLPLFTLGFILMLVFYKKWTKPAFFFPFSFLFLAGYFGLAVIDSNYLSILEKPDNVPISMMIIGTGLCVWLAFKQAAENDDRLLKGQPLIEGDKDDKVLVWPDLVYIELIVLLLGTALLVIWALVFRAPLEAPANPAGPPNPSKAPWYFLGLQEMLVYYDPWMAGVILPGLIIGGLIAIPYIDTNPKGNGYYTFKQRPFAISMFLFGFLILWVVLIVFGTFLRGPNWNFFGPTEYWDSHKQVPLTNVNLSEYWYNFLWNEPLPSNPLRREWLGILLVVGWLVLLPPLLAKTIMRRMFLQMGAPRFYTMAFLLVVMGLLPVKMVMRWVFTLKYFVYLPEFNLNF